MPALRIALPEISTEDALAIAEAIRSAGTLDYTSAIGDEVLVTVGLVTVEP